MGAPPVSKNLQKYADEIGIGEKLHFHGRKRVGIELNLMLNFEQILL